MDEIISGVQVKNSMFANKTGKKMIVLRSQNDIKKETNLIRMWFCAGNQNVRMGSAIQQAHHDGTSHGTEDCAEKLVCTCPLHDLHAVHHTHGTVLHNAVDSAIVRSG